MQGHFGGPSACAAVRFASSAARSPPSARAFSVAVATVAFSSASMRTRTTRPLVQRGAIHGRVMGQFGGLHDAAPRLLLGDVAGVDRRVLCSVSPAFGRGEYLERVAFRPGRLVSLDQPGADHVVDAAPGGVGVAVKMLVGQVCVGHGAIEPHVGHRIARACGPAAARPVARLGVGRARGGVPADGRWCVSAGRASRGGRPAPGGPAPRACVRAASSLAIPRILARPLGRAFLADASKPGVVRLVVGALLRSPLGMLAWAGGCLLKPLKVVAGGFLRCRVARGGGTKRGAGRRGRPRGAGAAGACCAR